MSRGLALTLSVAVAVGLAGMMTADQAWGQCGCSDSKSECKAKCPISGGEISKEASLDYKGGKLYFCCPVCISKFKENQAKYQVKANVQLVTTGQAKQVQCPLTGGKLDPSTKTKVCGVDICFCCAGCQEKVKNASADEQAALVFGKNFDKAFAVKQEKK